MARTMTSTAAGRVNRRFLFLALILAALLAAFSLPAAGHVGPCGKRSELLEYLAERYGEVPVGLGIAGAGVLVEQTLSANGSWSVILTYPGGRTCGVISGRRWEAIEPELPRAKEAARETE